MKGNIRISRIASHVVGRELTDAERQAADVHFEVGGMGGPVVHDVRLESHQARKTLTEGEGKVCVSVRAGKDLGEFYIAIQFEGPIDTGHGEPDRCIEGQNDLLLHASDWIADVLGSFDTEFDGVIEAQPCPKATKPLVLTEAAQRLDPTLTKGVEGHIVVSASNEARAEAA